MPESLIGNEFKFKVFFFFFFKFCRNTSSGWRSRRDIKENQSRTWGINELQGQRIPCEGYEDIGTAETNWLPHCRVWGMYHLVKRIVWRDTDNREDAYSRMGGIFIGDMARDTAYSLCFNDVWPYASLNQQWIYRIPCRIPYENASRTGVRILPNI